MLAVLLTILKIIGWILLAILALIVLVLLVVCLVPVRYQIEAHGERDLNRLKIDGRVTWLLRFLSIKFSYAEKELETASRIAWVKPGEKEEKPEKDKKQKKRDTDSEKVDLSEEAADVSVDATEKPSVEKVQDQPREQALARDNGAVITMTYGGPYEPEPAEISATYADRKEEKKAARAQKKEEKEAKKEKKQKEKQEKREAKEQKKREKAEKREAKRKEREANGGKRFRLPDFDHIREVVRSIGDRREDVMSFIENKSHRKALAHLRKRLKKTGKKLIPKDWELGGTVGMKDPYTTGRLAAIAATLYPFTGERMPLVFDFEEQALDLNGHARGKLRLGTLLAMIFPLLLDRHVWRTIKDAIRLKKRFDKTSELIKGGKAA